MRKKSEEKEIYVARRNDPVTGHWPVEMVGFLRTLEQLPSLERVYVTFHAKFTPLVDPRMPVVTLPHVQEMSLSRTSTNSYEKSLSRNP